MQGRADVATALGRRTRAQTAPRALGHTAASPWPRRRLVGAVFTHARRASQLLILGLSAFGHDSAAALVEDGRIVAAAQEERFTRRKGESGFPSHAIGAVLDIAGVPLAAVDRVAFHERPWLRADRLLRDWAAAAGPGWRRAELPASVRLALGARRRLAAELEALAPGVAWAQRLEFVPHHLSHAASAFHPSPFERAAVLTLDGAGEWAASSLALGEGGGLRLLEQTRWPHSIALLYSTVTQFAGFRPDSGEYKLMGLAPYGEPRFVRTLREQVVTLGEDGGIALERSCFDLTGAARLWTPRWEALFGGPPRLPEAPLTQRELDLAASVQALTEEIVLRLARHARRRSGERRLCLAGSVALNCVANGRLLRAGIFDEIWIQPAAGDAGGALGAALALAHGAAGSARKPVADDAMQGAFLGPAYAQGDVEARLRAVGARFAVLDDEGLNDACAAALERGEAIGWHQGRMEFGPRALGARSILADARAPTMQRTLNLKVKFRESFRPFAPAVLAEEAARWFELDRASPYMLFVADVHPRLRRPLSAAELGRTGLERLAVARSALPAVTHVDLSARVQTVHARTQPRLHALLRRFAERTGCPVLVNTSFNVRGEPIVCTPEDAFRCFMGSGIEWLAVGNCLLRKADQDFARHGRGAADHAMRFAPD